MGLKKIDGSLLIAEKKLVRALDVVSSFKRIVSDRTAQDVQAFSFNHDGSNQSTYRTRVTLSESVGQCAKTPATKCRWGF